MRSAIVVYGAAAALTAMLAVKLVQRGGPYFARPETVMDHLWGGEPCRFAGSLATDVAQVIPRGEIVACFTPINGQVRDDYCGIIATGYLTRQWVVPNDFVRNGTVDWVLAVKNPFDDPRYELVATYPDGRLYARRKP